MCFTKAELLNLEIVIIINNAIGEKGLVNLTKALVQITFLK